MAYRLSHAAIAAVLLAAAWCVLAGDACAQGYGAPGWTSPEPNYYAMPAGPAGLTAALYPSPRPTPPVIGQTLITYGPLAPQNFLYMHYHYYTTLNGCHQATRTSVTWGHFPPLVPSLTNGEPRLHGPVSACRY